MAEERREGREQDLRPSSSAAMAAAAAHQSIRLRLRCDYPQKDAVIQLPTGATVAGSRARASRDCAMSMRSSMHRMLGRADLKEAAESSLEMSQAELARYDWVVVPFGRDLRTLGESSAWHTLATTCTRCFVYVASAQRVSLTPLE